KDSPDDYAGLKDQFGTALTSAADNEFNKITLGYLNEGLTATATVPAELNAAIYKGIPDEKAFMHFPWYDAPLNNSFELMLIPTCSPGRFGVEFVDSEETDWVNQATSLGGQKAKFRDPKSGVGMYFNYFNNSTASLHLAELFEYIRVPSKFAGSVKWTKDTSGNLLQPYYALQEPGKINLNTATAAAWAALQGTIPTNFPTYEELRKKRENAAGLADTDMPSEFASPFRSSGAANLVPADALVRQGTDTGLFGSKADGTTTVPFIKPAGNDKDNMFASLQNVLQLGDLTTTRSNVFAVWVTIGYFKAEEIASPTPQQQAIYPPDKEGKRYVLGAERGTDGTSAVQRNRAFYLIDRSIPVGFRRGEKLNSQNVIVSKTVLE
ncbi:MAG: hypothetical protein LBN39_10845, partial [Planctomycetaceae bacterium]|nr:hypothetical protein [Planctomycetaceae bacterium]